MTATTRRSAATTEAATTETAPPPPVSWTKTYPWSVARFMVDVEEDNGDGTKKTVPRHRSRAMELIRRFGTSTVDDVLAFGDDDELGKKVATLVTGALIAGGSAPTCSKEDGIYEAHVRGYEDWCLWFFPADHPERMRVQSMQDALTRNDKTFRLEDPCDTACIAAYLQVLWAPKTEEYTTRCGTKRKFTGRGTDFANANNFLSAMKYVDRTMTTRTLLTGPSINGIMKEKKRNYRPRPAIAFDIAEVLPRAFQAIFAKEFDGRQNPFNTGLQRQLWWTMWLMGLACCARRSLFTTYCPRIDQVDVHTAAKDVDGFPKFMLLKLERWKGNADGKRFQTLIIKRNYADVRYCPVVAMCLWLRTLYRLGVTENGPLFPALSPGHNQFSRADSSAPLEYIGKKCYSMWWSKFCEYVGGGLVACRTTTHSNRRSVVKWGARSGGQWMDLQVAGRWLTNHSFMTYWKDGEALKKHARPGERDVINDIWLWVPIQLEQGFVTASGR